MMKNKWFFALAVGAALGLSAPRATLAQSTTGSNGGFVIPGTHNKAKPNSAAGSPGSLPETSLSRSNAANPVTREGDVPNQIAALAPYAAIVTLILIGGLYWFVFRKPTTAEGEAAPQGKTPRAT